MKFLTVCGAMVRKIMPKTRRKKLYCALAAVALLVILFVCIFIAKYVNIHSQYSDSLRKAGDNLYTNLYLLTETFDSSRLLDADSLSSITALYEAAAASDELLSESFDYELVINTSLRRTFESALNDYKTALNADWPTESAHAALCGAFEELKERIAQCYDENAHRK